MDDGNTKHYISDCERLRGSLDTLLNAGQSMYPNGRRVACALYRLYALMSTFRIRQDIEPSMVTVGTASSEIDEGAICDEIPEYSAVQQATKDLLESLQAKDRERAAGAFKVLGTVSLSSSADRFFSQMESTAEHLIGRAKSVPFAELAFFATEMGDFQRAKHYVNEAGCIGPDSWELHNICTANGLLALSDGNANEALRFLTESARVCQVDEFVSRDCGIRPMNLVLAEQLFESGQREGVLNYLRQCRDVWQSLRTQIECWITLIEDGETPDFHASRVLMAMNQPSYRFQMQWMRACALEDDTGPPARIAKSRADVIAGRKRLRTEYGLFKEAYKREGPRRGDS